MGPLRLGLQYVLSFVFIIQMYVAMAVVGIGFMPWALFSARGARSACTIYSRYVIWSAGWMVGLKTEVRGTPPSDTVMIGAKHQSFFDILIIFASVPKGRFIMKRELLFTPIIGQYAMGIGCVPVDRGKKGAAIKKMLSDVVAGMQDGGQLIIFAQGTRVPAGAKRPYKIGVGALYNELRQDCVPVATNVGVFWPRRSMLRMPGTAVVEFLPRIPAGKSMSDFMVELEQVIETRSAELEREAGFTGQE